MTPYYSDDGVTLWHGDALEVLRDLPDDSVHAVVTDPPYGLEFMGKDWDSPWKGAGAVLAHATERGGFQDGPNGGNPYSRSRVEYGRGGAASIGFQQWCETWAAECLRVLKPGGHLLAFGGTRTSHRLACAIEDAGFEIRDSIAWLYGCLDDQTEIMVDGRWEPYRNVTQGQHALGYDVEHDEFSWQPIERVVVFPYSDTAYRLVGDHSDQLVTREHRCIVERGGSYVFQEAQDAARERQARVPVLEDVRGLLDALPLPHEGAGGTQQNLLETVREPASRSGEQRTPQPASQFSTDVPCVRQGVPAFANETSRGARPSVLDSVPRGSGRRPDAGAGGNRSNGMDRSLDGVVPDQDDGAGESRMERRGDALPKEGQLQADQVRPMPTGVRSDGTQGRLRDGASSVRGDGDWQDADATGGRPPRGPRPNQQRDPKPVAVPDQPGPQTVRGARFTSADLVRITHEHYEGTAWCVTVATGAFVARRNGKVFVTGNSGFPKSLDVGKAIDKAAGAERDVAIGGSDGAVRAPRAMAPGGGVRTAVQTLSTPATPDAERWQGWGTAMKPAWENVVVARKPLAGTVAGNVLAHGTGGLNIDACRVGTDEAIASHHGTKGGDIGFTRGGAGGYRPGDAGMSNTHNLGRWPANVVLDQHQAAELDRQSGESASRRSARGAGKGVTETYGSWGMADDDTRGHDDAGGASRFFPTFRYEPKAPGTERPSHGGVGHPTVKPLDLMRFLVRLVTPPGGVVLEPFAGSGTTAEACLLEGFRCIAVEREADYLPLIVNRLTRRTDPVAYLAATRTDTDTPDLFTGVDDEAAS